jgi:peptidoglycan/xylan/chitin deacetylase (PgdA/CDA1 family)
MRAIVKRILYRLGAARALHRRRNRDVLTVAMFHRVLPPDDPRFAGANPTYTVALSDFHRILDLFARFYAVVDLAAVERAARSGAPLPPCPLLITFDDGWRDNAEFALPALQARRMKAVLFVASGFIGDARGFWQERVYDAVATRGTAVATREGAAEADARIAALAASDGAARAAALAGLDERPLPRAMADATELAAMQAGGMTMGGHGHSHTPLTAVDDPGAELATCRATLASLGLGGDRPSFSFPHGRCDAALVTAAQHAGFGLCFTSAAELTPVGSLARPEGIGRISIEVPHTGPRAGLDIAALAFSLITRPHSRG